MQKHGHSGWVPFLRKPVHKLIGTWLMRAPQEVRCAGLCEGWCCRSGATLTGCASGHLVRGVRCTDILSVFGPQLGNFARGSGRGLTWQSMFQVQLSVESALQLGWTHFFFE